MTMEEGDRRHNYCASALLQDRADTRALPLSPGRFGKLAERFDVVGLRNLLAALRGGASGVHCLCGKPH
jgi:hypothetical protein